jgi:hypothetical protein
MEQNHLPYGQEVKKRKKGLESPLSSFCWKFFSSIHCKDVVDSRRKLAKV